MKVVESKKKYKRFTAIFDNGKRVDFGQKGGKTYIDEKDKVKRKNYRARHEPNEKKFYGDPYRPSTLSRFLLWGEATNLKDAIKDYEKKFKKELK